MVFFTCNSCGSCVKKPQVEKHVYQCRNFGSLSCMDCNKDFDRDSYKTHTKCVTELERYSGEGWKAPAGHNKGEKKQNAWMDTVLATVEKAGKNATPAVKSLLHSLTKHENVPRKKPKFLNFVRNIGRNHFDNGTIESVWTLLEEQWKSEREAQMQNQNGKANSGNDIPDPDELKPTGSEPATESIEESPKKKKKKKKKEKHNENGEANPRNNIPDADESKPADSEPATESSEEPPKKKKKKHRENGKDNSRNNISDADEWKPADSEPAIESTVEPPKKKKKKHKDKA